MIRKLVFAFIALAVLVPGEIYAWVKWINPFFWSPEVAYTDLAWGYVLIGIAFFIMPVATVGAIFEEN